MVRPTPWWACPSCSAANDADAERCCKCGCSRSRLCEVPGCGRSRDRSGLCTVHRTRFARWGVGPAAPEGRSYSRPAGHSAGQALVETMLVLPVLLLLLIGFVEVSFLGYARSTYHDAAATLADGLAFGEYTYPSPEFDAIAADELARVGCDREALTVTMDTTGRVIVDLRCSYAAIAYHALSVPVSVEASR